MTTIFALATPEGRSGVAIYRISGSRVRDVLYQLTNREDVKPRQSYLCKLHEGGDHLDTALVLFFEAPHSYTGEDVLELHVHGSPSILKLLPKVLTKLGCVLAEPGEFTRRAFYNDRLDLTEVEGLSYLIQAETEAQRKIALRQASGDAKKTFEYWRAELIRILAYVEADIDFVEGEVPSDYFEKITEDINELISKVDMFSMQHKNTRVMHDGLRIALVGPPNVGKSTLYNYLVRRDAALVSDIAGTTRDVLETRIDFNGYSVILADMAGLREAESLEAMGIARAKKWQESADIKILMISHDQDLPNNFQDLLSEADLVLVTKFDLGPKHHVSHERVMSLSLYDYEKLASFERELKEIIVLKYPDVNAFFHMDYYQENIINKVLFELSSIKQSQEIEIIAHHIRSCLHEFGKLTGRVDVEEILGNIFSSFCIGK